MVIILFIVLILGKVLATLIFILGNNISLKSGWKTLAGAILSIMEVKNFAVWDYVVFAALFIISSGIGVFFAIKERKKASSREFLVGGRQMNFGPVALSLTASFMSAVTVLGAPSEVYRFGASFVLFFIAYTFVIIFTSELFLPVFYRSGITSTYEVRQPHFLVLNLESVSFFSLLEQVYLCILGSHLMVFRICSWICTQDLY